MSFTLPTVGFIQFNNAVLTLSGENTARWCNGMFSNNFRAMKELDAHSSAICDDRGRIQGFIDCIKVDADNFIGILVGSTLEWFTKRFQMYMILDDIEMEACNDTVLHLFGDKSADLLHTLGLPAPELGKATQVGSIWVRANERLRGVIGFDILSVQEESPELEALHRQLSTLQSETTQKDWEQFRISTGTAKFPEDFSDKSFIHEYDLQDRVCSFNKGCYVGQEIINRMDIKQLATKRLLRIALDGEGWTLGDELSLLEDGQEKKMGTITSLHSTAEGMIGLALLRKDAWSSETHLQGVHGTATVL